MRQRTDPPTPAASRPTARPGPHLSPFLLASLLVAGLLAAPVAAPATAAAAEGVLSGRVVDPQGRPVAGARIEVRGATGGPAATVRSGDDGSFRLTGLAAPPWELTVAAAGFAEARLFVEALPAALEVALELAAVRQEIRVTAGAPELTTELALPGRRLESGGAVDLAAALRDEPGLASVRRGAVNLEPVVRGLQEAEVAMLVDGTRTFAAGPARMDSDLSHVGLHAVESARVVKGPYALAWGAGAMSAIELRTVRPPFATDGFRWSGRAGAGGADNGDVADAHATLFGSGETLRLSLALGHRSGGDYQAGDGAEVPADFTSSEGRWSIGWRPAAGGTLIEYSGGYQQQEDLDYAGRLLDASYFYTRSHALEVTRERPGAVLSEVYVQAYSNRKDHRMNNDEKPTALPMPGRVPPFGIDVDLPAESNTAGGRFHLAFGDGDWQWKTGGDLYRVEQTAVRRIRRRDTGALLFADVVWPDAEIDALGGWLQGVRRGDRGELGATVRFDRVEAAAGRVSEFFLANAEAETGRTDSDWSAALSGRWRLSDGWLLSAGAGRTVRTATALERYSDRFPGTKMQISAELLGNPALAPETAVQLDLGTEHATAGGSGLHLRLDAFWRRIDDYITVVSDPTLPRRLPLSPPLVYRYVNSSRAEFWGGEAVLSGRLGGAWSWRAEAAYTRGDDRGLDEPVLGLPPLTGRAGVTLRPRGARWWADAAVTVADRQERVATSRGEVETPGYTRIDLRGGLSLAAAWELELGVDNLADETYADHLNARVPFTGLRVPEPGRSVFARVLVDF